MTVKAKKRWFLILLVVFLIVFPLSFAQYSPLSDFNALTEIDDCSGVSTTGSNRDYSELNASIKIFPWTIDASDNQEFIANDRVKHGGGSRSGTYPDSDIDYSVYWTDVDDVFFPGIEGSYYATVEFGEAGHPENESAFCQLSIHDVSWDDNPSDYCTKDHTLRDVNYSAGDPSCCGDDLFEDCGFTTNNQDYCVQYGSGVRDGTWEWIDKQDNALERIGAVNDLKCAGVPFLTTGNELVTCGFPDPVEANTDQGAIIQYEIGFSGNEVWREESIKNESAVYWSIAGVQGSYPQECAARLLDAKAQTLTLYTQSEGVSAGYPKVSPMTAEGYWDYTKETTNLHITAGDWWVSWGTPTYCYTPNRNQVLDFAYEKDKQSYLTSYGRNGGVIDDLTISTPITVTENTRSHPTPQHADDPRHSQYLTQNFVNYNYTAVTNRNYVNATYSDTGTLNSSDPGASLTFSIINDSIPRNAMPLFEFKTVYKRDADTNHDFLCGIDEESTDFQIFECTGASGSGWSGNGVVLETGDSVDLIVNGFEEGDNTEIKGFDFFTNDAVITAGTTGLETPPPAPPNVLKLESDLGTQYVDMTLSYFIPIDTSRVYPYHIWLKGDERVYVGLNYYDKLGKEISVSLSQQWILTGMNGVVPGENWTRYMVKLGPGNTAWPAGTKFVKVRIHALNNLNNNDGNTGEVWLDGLYFGKFYCTRAYNTLTADLDGTNEQSCTKAESHFRWTGTKCCGDPEPVDEFYNDPFTGQGVNGGCWNNTFVRSGDFVETENYEVIGNSEVGDLINYNGTFLGCEIDETDMIDDNEWLLGIKESKTNSDLVQNRDACTMLPDARTGTHYFCSFNERWEKAGYDMLETEYPFGPKMLNLSSIAWTDEDVLQQECCPEFDCWNGTACQPNQYGMADPTSTYGYRCLNGEWTQKVLKYTPNRENMGFCELPEQCLVNPSGDFNDNNDPSGDPQCILNGQYIKDSYCELQNNEGQWTTRTKILALQMLDFAETESTNDFTLYCGDFVHALNFYNYETENLGISVPEYVGEDFNNAFCILRYKDGVAFGTTVNKDIDSIDSFLKALDRNQHLCDSKIDNNHRFDRCSPEEDIWYDEDIAGIIYLPTGSLGTVTWWDAFVTFIKSPFTKITEYTLELSTEYDFFNKTGMFSKLYVTKKGAKYFFAVLEEDQYDEEVVYARDYIALKYKGLTVDICALAREFEGQVDCEYDPTNDEYLLVRARHALGTTRTIVDAWKDLTSKLRVV